MTYIPTPYNLSTGAVFYSPNTGVNNGCTIVCPCQYVEIDAGCECCWGGFPEGEVPSKIIMILSGLRDCSTDLLSEYNTGYCLDWQGCAYNAYGGTGAQTVAVWGSFGNITGLYVWVGKVGASQYYIEIYYRQVFLSTAGAVVQEVTGLTFPLVFDNVGYTHFFCGGASNPICYGGTCTIIAPCSIASCDNSSIWYGLAHYAVGAIVKMTTDGICYQCILAHNSNNHVTTPGLGAIWETYWVII
jgi:hypothetical protein